MHHHLPHTRKRFLLDHYPLAPHNYVKPIYYDLPGTELKYCLLNWKQLRPSRTNSVAAMNLFNATPLVLDNQRETHDTLPGGFSEPVKCLQEHIYTQLTASSPSSVERATRKQLRTLLKLLKTYAVALRAHEAVYKITANTLFSAHLPFFVEAKRLPLTVIIVTYLDREENLRELLLNLHAFLQRQYLRYLIVVAEQANAVDAFNKGRLYNAAFRFVRELFPFDETGDDDDGDEARREQLWKRRKLASAPPHLRHVYVNCIVLHDVDLVPESDWNVYECSPLTPHHLSLAIRKAAAGSDHNSEEERYERSTYELLVGGVLAMRPEIYMLVNGFSNAYFNWGGEDDGLHFLRFHKE